MQAQLFTTWLTENEFGFESEGDLIILTGTWLDEYSRSAFEAAATIEQLPSEDGDLFMVSDGSGKRRLQITPNDEADGLIKEWEGTENLEAIFDNGGGITLQCDAYVHSYDFAKDAARDAKSILDGDDTMDWEGNHPGHRIEVEVAHYGDNSGYEVMGRAELQAWLDSLEKISGYARREFMAAMIAEAVRR